MPLPENVDRRIRQRFDDLIQEAENLIPQMQRENSQIRARDRASGISFWGEYATCEEGFHSLRTKCVSLLKMLSPAGEHIAELSNRILNMKSKESEATRLLGILKGLRDDYQSGMLESLSNLIEANVTADYLGQAEQLLTEGKSGNYDYVPAAVLTGAILEDGLRRLCQRQNPPIAIIKSNGDSKTLNPLIDDLKKAGLYNELKAKQLRAWADIRNAAAHANFDEFTRIHSSRCRVYAHRRSELLGGLFVVQKPATYLLPKFMSGEIEI